MTTLLLALDRRLDELPLLTQVERHQLPMKHTSEKTEYPQPCIHKLVEAVVEQTPDAVAVVFEQSSLTYRQLNSRANNLSHHLQALGVGKEVLVGICMERSLEMLVGLLAFSRREERMCRLTQLTQLSN